MSSQKLATRIAGEVTLAENPGVVIRKWREIFKISQKDLARRLGMSPSVISDYESGRRKSPGTQLVSKLLNAMFEIDKSRGEPVASEYGKLMEGSKFFEAILAIREFAEPRKIKDVVRAVEGEFLVGEQNLGNNVYGYTVIDSMKAIIDLSPLELAMIYGTTTQRALIFVGVSHGRSPMIAIKLTSLRPSMVVLHGPIKEPDKLGVELARRERIPLVQSHVPDIDKLIENLRGLD
ncbi:MAG: helix-turn-helix domain-containing protein [Candidatus Altiarchaeota archaeon]|nr:helix-turn-helix domain-containing protein [Candidatus Altiarchaeota archaeon]